MQDKWINGHLTGVANRKILLAHEDNFSKAIHEKWNHNANAPCWKFVWRSKLRTLWSFSSLYSLLKTGYRVWLEISSISLLLVLEKTLHGKDASQDNKVQVYLLISLLKRLLVCFWKFSRSLPVLVFPTVTYDKIFNQESSSSLRLQLCFFISFILRWT